MLQTNGLHSFVDNDGLDSIGPEYPIAWARASATILILQVQAKQEAT